jgi:hypothetical protein
MNKLCADHSRVVTLSVTSNVYHFFVVRIFKIPSLSSFEISHKLLVILQKVNQKYYQRIR